MNTVSVGTRVLNEWQQDENNDHFVCSRLRFSERHNYVTINQAKCFASKGCFNLQLEKGASNPMNKALYSQLGKITNEDSVDSNKDDTKYISRQQNILYSFAARWNVGHFSTRFFVFLYLFVRCTIFRAIYV